MSIRQFEPAFMPVGILTAALQELTPRSIRDADPDRAVEDWISFARELGVDVVQLSCALHPNEADVPPEAMLDPVANTLDLRQPFDQKRAGRVEAALRSAGIGISDIGYFDNLLHDDAAIRRKKQELMRRVLDAAVMLGVNAVCGFVAGRLRTTFTTTSRMRRVPGSPCTGSASGMASANSFESTTTRRTRS